MSASTTDIRKFFDEYLGALNGRPKTPEVIDRFVTDPVLKQHIVGTESAFPSYELVPEQIVVEGDTIAMRATFRGIHKGEMAGFAPTGKQVSAPLMIFYRVEDSRIAEHWIQMNMADLLQQLSQGSVPATP